MANNVKNETEEANQDNQRIPYILNNPNIMLIYYSFNTYIAQNSTLSD